MTARTRLRSAGVLAAVVAVFGVGGWVVGARFFAPGSAPQPVPERPAVRIGDGQQGPRDMAWVPGGDFLMGSDHKLAQANESPAHKVRVRGFWMDTHHVTNAQFRAFVEATGYLTTAERKPDWATIAPQLPPGTPKQPESALVAGALVFVGTPEVVNYGDVSRWWRYVPGANWRHPQGPSSSIEGKDQHPVVQVSYEGACPPIGRRRVRLHS